MPKTDSAPKPDHSDWLTREEAAQVIGVSTKTVSKLERDRKLQRRNRSRPGQPPVSIYHPDDVRRAAEHYRRTLEVGILSPVDGHNGHNGTARALMPARNPGAILEALLHASSLSRVPITERVYLKLAEASEYSGLPQGYLRELVRSSKLNAITEGIRGWRIKRSDLEKL